MATKDIGYLIDSMIKNTVSKVIQQKGLEKLKAIQEESKKWKLDVQAWLSRSRWNRAGTEGGISRDGPLLKRGALRAAAAHYRVTNWYSKTRNTYSIKIQTKWGQVSSYTPNQKKIWNYSDILNESDENEHPEGYYTRYKDRYIDILHNRLADIIGGR